ncbi:Signal recognition particle core component [Cadophora gregata]|uniref:Signal recognition particle core component n=1 Tax=Cadophora gregata TaxID=51156 RepID=UPI0026DBAE51|nr:Signal recognition particle core component [Cadophora gregata]KAK0118728.1 Signal recognition particle core component [Cadophora gregata f. sp. sojae]KAK0125993.1 Signal recognition particle core component [Cadophora gregata]
MASNPTATLTSLLRGSTIEDHEEVLKAANAVLKSSKPSSDALHTRVVALLKLDRFDDALRALDDGGDKLAEQCVLEKAYALYKTGQLAEAERLASGAKKRGLKHVAAQVAYRAEKFEDAARIYQELSSQSAAIEGEENDLRINSSAADAQLEWQDNGDKVEPGRKKPSREDLEAFETSYNAACGCIARGDLGPGSVLLKRARDLCEALDELSDEEKRAEVLPIMVQQAYVFTKLGKLEEAEALQRMINTADVPEPPSRVVAQNNGLAVSAKHDNPFMTQRIFESVPNLSPTEKLFGHQASILERNRYIIDLQSQKYSGVAYSTASIISKSPSPTISPYISSLAVLNAAGHAKMGVGKASLQAILPILEKRPKDVGLILVIIQLYMITNNLGPAINLLESLFKRLEQSTTPADQDVRFAPGLVALAVSLYQLSGRKAPIKTELGTAASHWRRKPKPSIPLLRAAGTALLHSSTPEDLSAAGEIFSSLRKQDASDRTAIAGYVASYARTNLAKVTPDLEKLTPVSRLVSGINAAALEDAGIPSLPTQSAASKKRGAETEKEKALPPKKQKIRKSHMPKDFEEGRKMDPERWLPLRDRSSYRPKGKKGKKKAMDLTQGGVVKDEESLELAGGAGTVRVEKATGGKPKKKKGKK